MTAPQVVAHNTSHTASHGAGLQTAYVAIAGESTMTKIISFVPVNESLRDAVRAQGYDSDRIYANEPLWLEAVGDINGWLADPAMVLDDLSGDIDNGNSVNDLFCDIWDPSTPDLRVFIAPLQGGASAIVRAKLASDLHTMNNDTSGDPPAESALFVWDGTELVKIDLNCHG